jgi:hypothetical protein
MEIKKISVSIIATIFLALAIMPGDAKALLFINNLTNGYYNAGLGDLSLDSVLGVQKDAATNLNLFPAANVSGGDPLIPPIATEPNLGGADPGTQTNFGTWLGNSAPSGGGWSATEMAIPNTWAVNDETAISYRIDAGLGLSNFMVKIGVDNGVFAWFDGDYKLGALAPGGAFPNEYNFTIGAVSEGIHYLQILREDHGGATGWLIEATGTPIPEPATMLLFGAGLIGLAGMGRKKFLKK